MSAPGRRLDEQGRKAWQSIRGSTPLPSPASPPRPFRQLALWCNITQRPRSCVVINAFREYCLSTLSSFICSGNKAMQDNMLALSTDLRCRWIALRCWTNRSFAPPSTKVGCRYSLIDERLSIDGAVQSCADDHGRDLLRTCFMNNELRCAICQCWRQRVIVK